MDRSRIWSTAVMMWAMCLAVPAVIAQSEIVNRSFENGSDPGEATVLKPGSKVIQGWTVVEGEVSYVGDRWPAAQGARSVALLCGGGISQTMEVEPDQDYEVRFTMAGDPEAKPTVKTVVVMFGTEKRTFTFDSTGRNRRDMGWEARAWNFRANDKTTTLTFISPKAECSVPVVDNVRVTGIDIGVQAHPEGGVGRPAGNGGRRRAAGG